MKSRSEFKKKLALIAGGSEGIGLAVAATMTREGADVFILSRHVQKLAEAMKRLEKNRVDPSQRLGFLAADITDFAQIDATLSRWIGEQGTPDYLINCAGFARPGYLSDLTPEMFRDMMEVNYFGTVHLCKIIEPYFRKARKGTIVNTSSIAGFLGLFGYTGYCGSKFAVIGFSEALKRELKPFGIRVSVLCPPNTKTPGLEKENQWKPNEVLATEEKIKVVEPEFVAETLLKGLLKNRFLIIPTLDGKMAYLLNRYAPSLLEKFVARKIS
jgi:3-dehydrosphinganine reductase